jgi:hypothetical protein
LNEQIKETRQHSDVAYDDQESFLSGSSRNLEALILEAPCAVGFGEKVPHVNGLSLVSLWLTSL